MVDPVRRDPLIDLPLRTSADTTGEVKRVLGKLESTDQRLKILQVLANATSVFRPFVLLSNGLMNVSGLPPADREAMILHVAAQRGTNYEWEEHVSMSERVGVTEAQRHAIRDGDLTSLSDSQRLAISVADDMLSEHAIGADRWQQMVATWGEESSLDLVIAVGWWGAFVPTLIEALGLHSPR